MREYYKQSVATQWHKIAGLPISTYCKLNACLCGYHNHPTRACVCSPCSVARYQKRISGPLLDRVDIFIDVPPVEYEKLVAEGSEDGSTQVRRRVEEAREVHRTRFNGTSLASNSEMGPAEVWKYCQIKGNAAGLLQAAMNRILDMPPRAGPRPTVSHVLIEYNGLTLARIHRRTPMDGVRAAEGGG